MTDEAFIPFGAMIEQMLAIKGEITNPAAGVRSCVYEFGIESPIEISVARDENGALHIGAAPPLYRVNTSIRPSYHQLSFTAVLSPHSDAD